VSELHDPYELERKIMIETQLRARGIVDENVLQAMNRVPRQRFVPAPQGQASYWDLPLPIGYGQTISQPYIVALMSEQATLRKACRVLEIGTGSGYQTAILAELVEQVYTIELISALSLRAQDCLAQLGYSNIAFAVGDGYLGWSDQAPFDAIIVTAAPAEVPDELLQQLAIGGRMLIPVGDEIQELYRIDRHESCYVRHDICGVRFVPMRHQEGDQKNTSS
jgi:protein-L-isoaspartate(D-aspartate) O-methyltransferase